MPKQYITDTEGQKISVILPMEEYRIDGRFEGFSGGC